MNVKEGKYVGPLVVDGDLDLRGCTSLTELPEGLVVGGYLYLSGCTSLKELPKGLSVGWSIHLLGCTSLTKLPEGLSAGMAIYTYPREPNPNSGVHVGEDVSIKLPFLYTEIYNNPARLFITDRRNLLWYTRVIQKRT